jgi:hypothetical protein
MPASRRGAGFPSKLTRARFASISRLSGKSRWANRFGAEEMDGIGARAFLDERERRDLDGGAERSEEVRVAATARALQSPPTRRYGFHPSIEWLCRAVRPLARHAPPTTAHRAHLGCRHERTGKAPSASCPLIQPPLDMAARTSATMSVPGGVCERAAPPATQVATIARATNAPPMAEPRMSRVLFRSLLAQAFRQGTLGRSIRRNLPGV